MRTILFTGGTGFIGSAFAHYIYRKYPEYQAVVVDCLTYAGDVENFPIRSGDHENLRFAFWSSKELGRHRECLYSIS